MAHDNELALQQEKISKTKYIYDEDERYFFSTKLHKDLNRRIFNRGCGVGVWV